MVRSLFTVRELRKIAYSDPNGTPQLRQKLPRDSESCTPQCVHLNELLAAPPPACVASCASVAGSTTGTAIGGASTVSSTAAAVTSVACTGGAGVASVESCTGIACTTSASGSELSVDATCTLELLAMAAATTARASSASLRSRSAWSEPGGVQQTFRAQRATQQQVHISAINDQKFVNQSGWSSPSHSHCRESER